MGRLVPQFEKTLQALFVQKNDFFSVICTKFVYLHLEIMASKCKNPRELDIWSNDYFLQLAGMMRFE